MSAFTGTARLTRLALRRDRVQLPIWILGTTAMLATSVSSIESTFPTEAERVSGLRTAATSPALLVLRGIPTDTSLAAMVMFQVLAYLAVLAGFMSTLAVVRHTRQNEETGRAEMIGATVVGRHASLTAALIVVAGANAVLAALLALFLVAGGQPAASSIAAGAAVGAAGLAFAGIAAVAAQVTQGARAANGIAAAAIGAGFLLRGFGDALGNVKANGIEVVSAWPSWLSPIGWAQQLRPFAGERWWVLAIPVALFAAGVAVAFLLTTRRDVGMGMIPARRGAASAARSLLGPLGLAWRLQRGTLLGWAIGIVALSLTTGSLSNAVKEGFGDNANAVDLLENLGGGGADSLVDTFFAAMMAITGAAVAGYVVQALLRLRSEETGTAEAVLATATGRLRWLASHVICAVAGAAVLLGLAGVTSGLVYGLAENDIAGKVVDLTGAALAQLPGALVLAGFAVAAFGLLPRLAVGLAWAGLAISLVFGLLGDLLNLPQAVQDISPFSHLPTLPGTEATAAPLVALVAVAAALGAAGLASFRRRDLAL